MELITEEQYLSKIISLETDVRSLEMTCKNWHMFLEQARKDGRYNDAIPADKMVFRDKTMHPKPLTVEEVAAYHGMTDVKELLGINPNAEVVVAKVEEPLKLTIVDSPSNFRLVEPIVVKGSNTVTL